MDLWRLTYGDKQEWFASQALGRPRKKETSGELAAIEVPTKKVELLEFLNRECSFRRASPQTAAQSSTNPKLSSDPQPE